MRTHIEESRNENKEGKKRGKNRISIITMILENFYIIGYTVFTSETKPEQNLASISQLLYPNLETKPEQNLAFISQLLYPNLFQKSHQIKICLRRKSVSSSLLFLHHSSSNSDPSIQAGKAYLGPIGGYYYSQVGLAYPGFYYVTLIFLTLEATTRVTTFPVLTPI